MAGWADDKGFASPLCHELFPHGLWPSRPAEVGKFPDVVYVYVGPLLAEFTAAGPEPMYQFRSFAAGVGRGWQAVGEDRAALPL